MQNYLIVLLALTSQIFASPIEASSNNLLSTREEVAKSGVEISTMQFHGPITPGGPEVQLSGTAKEIYEQILVLNPDYDVFAFPDSAKKLADSGVTRENIDNPSPEVSTTAAVRARNVLKRQDGINCHIGRQWTNFGNCSEGLAYLRRLGTGWCRASPNQCARVSCSWGCGMYLCSKGSQIDVHCQDIATDIQYIRDRCWSVSALSIVYAGGRRAFYHHNIELGNDNC